MLSEIMSKRYIGTSPTELLLDRIDLARIQPGNSFGNLNSIGSFEEKGRFNPDLFYDVRDNVNVLTTKTNRTLTKYENQNPQLNDIALYNIRNHSLNAEDVPGMYMKLHNEQIETSRSKVRQKETWRLPAENNFNPYLPISETNKPPENYGTYGEKNDAGRIIDERMIWHTADKQYTLPSDRQQQAMTLHPSNNAEILERNRRQKESDDIFLKRGKQNRWVEDRMKYHNESNQPWYQKDETTTKLSKPTEVETFGKNRHVVDPNDIKNRIKESQGGYISDYERKLMEMNEQKYRTMNLDYDKEAFGDTETDITHKKGALQIAVDSVSSFFSSLFNRQKQNKPEDFDFDNLDELDKKYISNTILAQDRMMDELPLMTTEEKYKNKERLTYKPDHVHVMKTGEINTIFPDDNFDNTIVTNTADTYKTLDPTGTDIVRTNVLLDRYGRGDAKLIIVQKRVDESVFINDGMEMGDDYIVVELPIENITKKFRDKIIKNNLDTDRSQPLKLEYEDFVKMNEYIEQHPDKQRRVKRDQLNEKMRKNVEEEFENIGSSFIDHKVYNNLAENKRSKLTNKRQRMGVALDLDTNLKNIEAFATSVSNSLRSSDKSANYRNTDLSKQNTRRIGVTKGRFDKR